MKRTSNTLWLACIAVLVIVIAFFIISLSGYMMGDDLWMHSDVSTLFELVKYTGGFYFYRGGRLFSVASQYLFSGVLGNHRIWYAIANTLFFVLFIATCGKLIRDRKKGFVSVVLLFALLFWFLCPVPKNTLFWIAGSTTYLWANTLSFVFVLLFLKYKDDNFGGKEKLGLFVLSFLAATEFITCASICGAFVVYYAFNIKKFKGNAIPFVIGFVMGSIFLLFAPGNFRRASWDSECASILDVRYLLHHPVQELLKYKVLWAFLAVLVWGWIKNKVVVRIWVRNNAILLLSLGWSVIAYSVVFRPVRRALFFTETLSIILLLRFLYDNYSLIGTRFVDKSSHRKLCIARNVVVALLFVMFVVDATFAAIETNKQRKNNEVSLDKIVDSGGFVVLDQMLSSHRMAYAPAFGPKAFRYLAKIYDMDSIYVYPYYCQDKYFNQGSSLDNVYVAYDYYADDPDEPNNIIVLIVRIEEEIVQRSGDHVIFAIDYEKPRKWYTSWLEKWFNYQYERTMVYERYEPVCCYEGFCYYAFYFYRDDAKNLKSVTYEFE